METGLEGKPWYYGAGVAVLLAVALVAGGYYGKFEKMKRDIKKQGTTLEGLQAKIKEGEAAERQLPQFQEEVERLRLELDKLLRILPSKRKTEEILRRIRSLTEQGDFLFVSFSPRPIRQLDDFYSEWPIQVELDGSYHNLALFFDRVGRFSRIMNVEDLRISPHSARTNQHHTIKARFMLKTFLSHETEDEELN